MKRWLIAVSPFVFGLLMVGWEGDALAARHPPSFLQKILAMFAPNQDVGSNEAVATQTAETSPSLALGTASAVDTVQSIEGGQPAPAPQPVREPVQTTREKKADRLKPLQLVQTAPVQTKPATDKTWTLASLHVVPAPVQAVAPPTPVRAGTMPDTAESSPTKTAIERAQPVRDTVHSTPPIKKARPGASQSVEITQPVPPPVRVAILGAPNLKAALPVEDASPIEAPRPEDEPRAPAARPEAKSACNGGQRIVSAYYWEGHHTASGQPFNPRAMTAAHRTLPFGTRLNVTNPRTGKTVNVVVNDRGPYVRGVSLDLSLGAAQAIGLQGTGSVCVL